MKTIHTIFALLTLVGTQACIVGDAPPGDGDEEVGMSEDALSRPSFPGGFHQPGMHTEWLDCGDASNSECVECKYPPGGPIGDGVVCCFTSNCTTIPK